MLRKDAAFTLDATASKTSAPNEHSPSQRSHTEKSAVSSPLVMNNSQIANLTFR
jgi:hypothetical protein